MNQEVISLDVNGVLDLLFGMVPRRAERDFCEEVFKWLKDAGDQISDIEDESEERLKRAEKAEERVEDLEREIERLEAAE